MSWLLLVRGSRKRVNKDKVSADDRKSSGSVLLSTAAKLRVVAERDLCEKKMRSMLQRGKTGLHSFSTDA